MSCTSCHYTVWPSAKKNPSIEIRNQDVQCHGNCKEEHKVSGVKALVPKTGLRSLWGSHRSQLCVPDGRSRVLVLKGSRSEAAVQTTKAPILLPETDDHWGVSKQLPSQILTHSNLAFWLRSAEISYPCGCCQQLLSPYSCYQGPRVRGTVIWATFSSLW